MALCGLTVTLLAVVMSATRQAAAEKAVDGPPGGRSLRVLVRPAPAFSHWAIHASISQQLVERGHTVAYVYSDEEEDMLIKLGLPRNSSFAFKHPYPLQEILELNSAERLQAGATKLAASVMHLQGLGTAAPLRDLELMQHIKDFEPDVIQSDIVMPTGMVVADLLEVPKVIVSPAGAVGSFPGTLLNTPSAVTLTPQFPKWVPQPMGFLHRLANLSFWVFGNIFQYLMMGPAYNKVWQENGMPSTTWLSSGQAAAAAILQCEGRCQDCAGHQGAWGLGAMHDLLILTTCEHANLHGDFAFLPAVPLSPHVHVVGALTPSPAKQLPPELLRLCEASQPSGVVYVSMGTTAIPEPELLKGILTVVSALNVTVIWKLTSKDQAVLSKAGAILPPHVHAVKFAPQNDLLGHGAVRAFITQGGSNSLYESLYHGVPPVIIPLFVEQPMNAQQAAMLGVGQDVTVPFPIQASVLAPKLGRALQEVLGSDKFYQAAAHTSRLMRARRWTPAEEAASVIEAVGWNGGSTHRQMLRHHQPWYVLAQLDTMSFLALVIAASGYVGVMVLRLLVSWISPAIKSSKQPLSKSKKLL